MCGIDGLVLQSELVSEVDLKSMTDMMIHRGPDGGKTFVRGGIGLGHRRLRVIDLSENADQPLFNETSDVAVVFNGEIYNFKSLRSELESKGHVFKTRTDTEVLVHAYEEWDTEAFARLNGMFAFGLWDGRGREPVVYLVRDRFGIKPLFYASDSKRLAFASELKPLFNLAWVDKTVSSQSLFHFLKFSHVPCPDSIVRGIRQIRPGTWLRVTSGDFIERRYYDTLNFSTTTKETRLSESEWVDEFQNTLITVMKRQIVADVPTGCFLSGGIDSSLLVWAYSQLGGPQLDTFTIGYKEKEFDESAHAREVAKVFKTNHHEWIASPQDFFDLIPDLPEYFDQPLGDPTMISSLLLSRFARQKVTVAFSGDGGDELFCGYSFQKILHELSGLAKTPKVIRKFAGAAAGRMSKNRNLSLQRLGKIGEIIQFENESELFEYFIGTVGPLRLDRLAGLVRGEIRLDPPVFEPMVAEIENLAWDEKIQQVFLRTFLMDTVLAKTDRAGMAFGLEARVPFLDDAMVELASRLPFHMKLHLGSTKYLLRRALARNVPDHIANRPKQGFSIPLREWFRKDLKYLLDEYLQPVRLKREGLLDGEKVHELVKSHVEGFANHSHLLWSLVNFQMWKERYLG